MSATIIIHTTSTTISIYIAVCLACFFAGFAAGVAVQTWRNMQDGR